MLAVTLTAWVLYFVIRLVRLGSEVSGKYQNIHTRGVNALTHILCL